MPDGIINRLPNLTAVLQTSASVESGLGGLSASLTVAGPDANSPLSSVFAALEGVKERLSLDVGGLTTRFPAALETMRNALPADSIEFVRSISSAYDDARNFLETSPPARHVRPGGSLHEAGMEVVNDALRIFDEKQRELMGKLIDPATLQTVTSALESFNRFRTDFAAHRDDFLPFLTQNLLGVAPDVFSAPLAHLNSLRAVFAPLQTASVNAALDSAQQQIATTFRNLTNEVLAFNPADAAAFGRVNALLDSLETGLRALQGAASPLYRQAQSLIDDHAWDSVFTTLRGLLQSVTVAPSAAVDKVLREAEAMMDALLARLQTFIGPQDLTPRIEALNRQIRELFLNSPLGQIRRSLQEFLERIRQAIEAVPTERIQQTIEQLLDRVGQEIESLGLESIGQTIEQALGELENFINQNINQALREQVRGAVQSLLANLNGLPIATLTSAVENVIEQITQLIAELETALQSGMDQLAQPLAELETLSFKPVGDAVVAEINDLKTRLRSINPNALSSVEKLAIKAALVVLEEINLEEIIATEVKNVFNQAKDGAKSLLDELTALLNRLRERLEEFQPRQLMGALETVFGQLERVVDGLNAGALCAPLYRQIDEFAARLNSLSPGALLDPLQQPYQAVLSAVNQLNPDQLIEPLDELYKKINKLIDLVDVTPLLDELDRRQKELFNNARASLLSAIEGLNLPEPMGGFFNGLRPVLMAMTDAIFQNSDAELKKISLELSTRFNLTGLFAPLDRAFDELLRMLASVPANKLVSAFESIRTGIGVALDALNPRRILELLRTGERQLAELSPRQIFALSSGLPSLRLALQAKLTTSSQTGTATLARFDAVIQLTGPVGPNSLLEPLAVAHERLVSTLHNRINALDPAAAETAYGALRESLEHALPDFLRRAVALTQTEILAGFEGLRPSRKAENLARILNRFLQQLQPMQAALEPAMNDFFRALHDTVDLLNPLSLKDAVADIYTAIREKVRILDPAKLAESLHTNIYDPLLSALETIDPAALKTRLDQIFQSALNAVTGNIKTILDDIVAVLDQQLQMLRTATKDLANQIKQAAETATQAFDGLVERVEQLVFVEVLERLRRLLDTLGVSFGQEVDRIRSAFDEMLAAIPLSGGASASASA